MHPLLLIIIAILVISCLAETILVLLNTNHSRKPLPAEVKDIYGEDEYRRSIRYEAAKERSALVSMTFSLIVTLLLLLLNGFAGIDEFARTLSGNETVVSLLFFAFLAAGAEILNLPFTLYNTFVTEEKFGFNKTTVRTFIADKIKSWLLGGIIGGMLLYLFILFFEKTGTAFWIYAWVTFSLFAVLMSMFYTSWIVPLFNKLSPLPEGELRNAIEEYCKRTGFKLGNLFIIDGSRRSAKANAFFSGLGSRKRIVLYDTLVNNHTTEEIVAVLAHETGHYKKKHTRTNILLSLSQMGLMLFLLSWFIGNPEFSYALGSSKPSLHLGLISFVLLYSPVSEITGILMNRLSRSHEFEADRYASETYSGKALKSALKKLSVNNLTNLNPHPAYVYVHYSHPPLLQRLRNIDN